MAFTYDNIFAVDPHNPANIAKNASITIFDPADATQAPIAIQDPSGSPLSNPITVDAAGMSSAFQHPTLARVGWKGAGFTGYFTSYEGMFNETVAAKDAAQSAVGEAEAAAAERVTAAAVTGGKLILTKATGATVDAGSVIGPKGDKGDKGLDGANVLPTQQAIEQAITTDGPAKTALSATIDTQVATATVPKWKPNTAYAVNDRVISPSGDTVLAKVNFTSGASYDPANWNLPLNITNKLTVTSNRQRLGNRWAFLGDSIMVGGWSGLLHSDTWPTYAALYSKGKIQIVTNAGISGNTTAQMLARVQADVIAKAPQVCAVSGGTNDISQGVTLATFKANIIAIIAALRAANIAPVLATITPNAVSTARTASTALWNQWIRRYAAQEQIPLIDFHAMMADPANGQFKAGFNSGDNIHPGAEGYRAMGEYAVTVMSQHLQPAALPLAVDGGDTYNLLQSPTFMTDAGGGLSTGWIGIRAGTGTRAFSRVDDPNIIGKWLQTDATAWTADVGVGNYQNTDLANKFVAGDKVAVSGLLSVPALGADSTIVVEFKANPTTSWLVVNGLTRPLPGIVAFYGEYTMPSGFTGYELDAYLKNPTGGTNTGTIKIAQVSVYNLTKHGI